MIAGIGIDMIEIARVMEKISRPGFKEHVFTPTEIAYCERMRNSGEQYAARFAAKEALLKAFGTGLSSEFTLNEIGIVNNELGQPAFEFTGSSLEIFRKKSISTVHVSLSHLKDVACAVVVIEQ